VGPVQWAMAKGHTIGKMVMYQMVAETARIDMDEVKTQRLNLGEPDRPTAPRAPLNNLDRIVNWSNESLSRLDGDRVYLVTIVRDEQIIMGDMAVDREAGHEVNRG
jgi:hypothetical protein